MIIESDVTEATQGRLRTSPRVTVVIPAFRAAKYIAEALDSVCAQTFTDFEIVVVNDVSPDTDELEEVLSRYRERVTYLKRDRNGGPGAARNTGILAARGEYVAFLDADDYWDPTFLAEQMAFFERHPDVSLVYSDASWFLDSSRAVVGTLMTQAPSRGEPTFERLTRQECTIGTSAVVVRREAVVTAGLFDPDIGNYSEDFDLYLRIAKSGARLAYQRKLLVHHRIHPDSLSAESLQLQQGALRVLRKTAARPDLTPEQREDIARTAARAEAEFNLRRARMALTRRDFREALQATEAAYAFYRTWKVKAIMVGLRLFPGLLLRIDRFRGLTARRRAVGP
jgi:GT2 family glycosyltransferase